MKMIDLVRLCENMEEESVDVFIKGGIDTMSSIGEYLDEMAYKGKEIIVAKLDERNFVRCMAIVRSTLLTSMIVSGRGASLTISEMGGELKPFVDTVVLSVVGILADEEVI